MLQLDSILVKTIFTMQNEAIGDYWEEKLRSRMVEFDEAAIAIERTFPSIIHRVYRYWRIIQDKEQEY